MLDAIRTLYAYGAWANGRVLDTAARLPAAQFVRDTGCGAVRETLVHIASAQWTWLERWRGVSPGGPWDPAEFPDVATLRSRWGAVEAETAGYVDGLQEADLDKRVSYVNYQGEIWTYPLWQHLLHQANHATQHRSEAALQLTRLGVSPGWLDLLVYIDEGGASADSTNSD